MAKSKTTLKCERTLLPKFPASVVEENEPALSSEYRAGTVFNISLPNVNESTVLDHCFEVPPVPKEFPSFPERRRSARPLLYDFSDRPLEVRWKGPSLPYRVFSKDQRVSHTAIIENKRLSHALATVKAQQDLKQEPKIKTNSDKGGYKKNPRRVYGPDYVPKSNGAPAVEMTA